MVVLDPAPRVRHYRSSTFRSPAPALLFEVDLELQDVRSRYRDSFRVCFQAEWLEERELFWTRDMVREIRKETLEEVPAATPLSWPEYGDEKMILFLTQHYQPQIWRNGSLGLYSRPGENQEEFVARCRRRLLQERLEAVKKFWDVFVRRFLELEQRMIDSTEQEEWEEGKRERVEEIREMFTCVRDSLGLHALPEKSPLLRAIHLDWKRAGEGRQTLDALMEDLALQYNRISRAFEEKASQVEPYGVPVTFPQVEIVSRGILWGPSVKETA